MTTKILKRAAKSPATGEDDTRAMVREMLAECGAGAALPARMRESIQFAHARVKRLLRN